jgi:hypothetical protein
MTGSFGLGIGHVGLLTRFKPAAGDGSSVRNWLLRDVLPGLPSRPGIGSVHLFEGAVTPPMTSEQRIRGADAGFDWALLLTGYDQDALASLMQADLGDAHLQAHGATQAVHAMYRIDYSLTDREVDA